MKPHPECGICMLQWIYERTAHSLEPGKQFQVMNRLVDALAGAMNPSVHMGKISNQALRAVADFILEASGSYEDLKRKSNEAAKQLLGPVKTHLEKGKYPREKFEKACGIAAVSNVAPIGAPSAPFEFSLVEDILQGRAALPRIAGDIYGAASGARSVFYVADNAGEIGFDSLVISLLKEMGIAVTLAVKGGPFFDDATMEEVHCFGLERLADKVIRVERGFFDPDESVGEAAALYSESDLVISKGTGNFEVLMGNTRGKKALFLLKAKCPPVARETNTPQGEFVARLEE